MDSVESQIILVIDCTGLEHNHCSMLMDHDVYAEMLSLAVMMPCNYTSDWWGGWEC